MVKRFAIALVLVVLVCGGLVGFNLFRSKMIGEFFANMPVQNIAVSTTNVEASTWKPQIDAIGTLRAAQGVDVATEAAGVVTSIDFQANDHIEKNALLVQLDDAVERADLMSAEAAVDRDRAQLERAKRLRTTGVNSQATLDDAQSALAASTSALAKVRAVLEQKSIEAPFAGVIGIPRIDVGEYLQPGAVIATLQQLDTMKVDFTVPEQQVDNISMEQPASFSLTGTDFAYDGKIVGIDPKIDPQTRLVSVRAEVKNPKGELRPGQFVRVRVELPAIDNVIALPQTAVVTSLYGDYVFVVEPEGKAAEGSTTGGDTTPTQGSDDTLRTTITPEGGATDAAKSDAKLIAKQVFVQIGRRQGDLVQVSSGLSVGQVVVTSGQNKLANNAHVTINNEANPAAVALDGGDGKS